VTEAVWGAWKDADFNPYLEIVGAAFGEDRLMFGSDWPVCLVAAEYERVFGIVNRFIAAWSSIAQKKILGANAKRFYLGHPLDRPRTAAAEVSPL
jgi:L-fuconolactonase